MKSKNDAKTILGEITDELLGLMTSKSKANIEEGEDGLLTVNIEGGEETGLLIGKKGETLSSLQMILSVMLKIRLGEFVRVVVNVGDWREREEEYLKSLASSTAQRVKETGEPQNLYNLKSWQRRLIHLSLAEDAEIETESQGEGDERFLVVRLKK